MNVEELYQKRENGYTYQCKATLNLAYVQPELHRKKRSFFFKAKQENKPDIQSIVDLIDEGIQDYKIGFTAHYLLNQKESMIEKTSPFEEQIKLKIIYEELQKIEDCTKLSSNVKKRFLLEDNAPFYKLSAEKKYGFITAQNKNEQTTK